ncbi:MAG: flagellar protein export ATPase FliI [Firmicutes bacterium HGW-Firmicutes-12]|jgi:flagellum-specific ATP synthase|nr:MAG: flagellar protein export ATPase FliI [Firmicutes bacterium HGW-Firmicutes-12]
MIKLDKLKEKIQQTRTIYYKGVVTEIIGLVIQANGPKAGIGEIVLIEQGKDNLLAEVVGFRENKTLLMPLGSMNGITPGSTIIATGETLKVRVGPQIVGRILNGLGEPIDELGKLVWETEYPLESSSPHPLMRNRIKDPLPLGIKAIDGLLTCGDGQRLGIFSGSGVGKSTILGMIARESKADINVIALIGERGREVREFIENDLGEKGLKRSVVIVATSDQPALVRIKGAFLATAVAEYFRDQGAKVVMMMDSVTRFAMAQREIGLAIGEPPATKGYTPSVFALLPRLLERTGTSEKGSITGLYSVLVDADDVNEPISDAVRGILDGHIILSRQLAAMGHYPAIDVLNSVSRVMLNIVSNEHHLAANKFKEILSIYREAKDLIDVGAYQKGSNHKIDLAINIVDTLNEFMKQGISDISNYSETLKNLLEIYENINKDEKR